MKISILVFAIFSTLIVFSIAYPADTNTVSVTAVVLSKSECKFSSKTATLNFGNLDSTNPVDNTVSTTIHFRCGGSAPNATFSITDDDGLYESGPNAHRMRNTVVTTEYLPYTLRFNPESGTVPKNSDQTLTITGTVKGSDYQDAYAGTYSDSVVVSVAP